MTENISWKSYYQQEPIEDIYFKFVCFYQAMIELYDRKLTDERSLYDKTEAYFGGFTREYKIYSNQYAKELYDCVAEYIRRNLKTFDITRWKKQTHKRYSAQGWIDMFEHFKKEKDKVILDMIENICDYGKIRNASRKRNRIIIKNPFL